MTDKEMAQQIAEELQRFRNRVDSLEILMSKYRTVGRDGVPIPWRQDLKEQESLQEYRELMQDRATELAQLIGGEEFGSSPFLAVWKKYCQSHHR